MADDAIPLSLDVRLYNQRGVVLTELASNGLNYVKHRAATSLSADSTYSWPVAPGSNSILQSDSNGDLSWVTGAPNGANLALSNLASVAINTSLVSDTDNTDDLGTTSIAWRNLYLAGSILTGSTSALTIAASGAVTIRGTATNDNAAAGFVGQVVSSSITASTNFPATNTYGDLTSISLTAGDWDVTAILTSFDNGATTSEVGVGISVNAADSGTGLVLGDTLCLDNGPVTTTAPIVNTTLTTVRMSLSGTTTVYFKYRAVYTGGPPQARGTIRARRVR